MKLLDIYKSPRTSGIFFHMSKNTILSELFARININTADDYTSMDMDYLYNRSGLKTPSVLLEYIFKGFIVTDLGDKVILNDGRKVTWDYVLTLVDEELINNIIRLRFDEKWSKLIDTLEYQYNALTPFSMTVEETQLNKRNIETDSENSNENSSQDNIFAYNSNEASPSSSDSYKSSSNSKIASKNTDDNKRNTTRSGNIGNKSSMQLIEEEREMLRYQVILTIYEDLDSVLTRSKYN